MTAHIPRGQFQKCSWQYVGDEEQAAKLHLGVSFFVSRLPTAPAIFGGTRDLLSVCHGNQPSRHPAQDGGPCGTCQPQQKRRSSKKQHSATARQQSRTRTHALPLTTKNMSADFDRCEFQTSSDDRDNALLPYLWEMDTRFLSCSKSPPATRHRFDSRCHSRSSAGSSLPSCLRQTHWNSHEALDLLET